jgi:RNA polymerase sigma-70 factor (ECF subfamily)
MSSGEAIDLVNDRGTEDCAASVVLDEHIPRVYGELRRIAAAYLRGESAAITLQPTALVHEVFVRLSSGTSGGWSTPEEFFGLAALAMRQLLVDHARSKMAIKRGGRGREGQGDAIGFMAINQDSIPAPCVPDAPFDAAALNDALAELEHLDPRLVRVVELRFFLGLTVPEVAKALSTSISTVEGDWRLARAWLASRLTRDPEGRAR